MSGVLVVGMTSPQSLPTVGVSQRPQSEDTTCVLASQRCDRRGRPTDTSDPSTTSEAYVCYRQPKRIV
jgi:hypothetical protein